MTVTFPNSPVLNQEYDAQNGLTYVWDGEKWSSRSAYSVEQDIFIRKNGYNTAIFADTNSVGIGTNTPSEKLEVAGTIKATDINFTGLQTFADDAAAGAGGLASGDVYKTADNTLKIKA